MSKGTLLIGRVNGSEHDRAFINILGYIDSGTNRLVKMTGEVIGSDGGAGIQGKRIAIDRNRLKETLSKVASGGLQVAGTMAGALVGRGTVVVNGAGYRALNPITDEAGQLVNAGDKKRHLVRIEAGQPAFVMVADLPPEVRAVAAPGEDDLTRSAASLTDREVMELIIFGTPEDIRAAQPLMNEEQKRLVLKSIRSKGIAMIPADPNREMIDPRRLLRMHGREALAELVARESGYIFQLRPLKDLCLCLMSGMPLLAEGERGGGKTEMVDALAYSCNRPYFELQGMEGLSLQDILFQWDEKGQHSFVVQAVQSGALNLEEARHRQWSLEFLNLGEVLKAYDYLASTGVVPIVKLDEFKSCHKFRRHSFINCSPPAMPPFRDWKETTDTLGLLSPMRNRLLF